MASQIDPLRSFIEESNRPYFVAMVKKEIKYLFSWLLQNDLQGGEILFEIQKARLTPQLFYFKQHLSTSEVILQLLQLPRVRKCMLYFLLKLSPAESRKSDIAWRWVIFQKYQMRRFVRLRFTIDSARRHMSVWKCKHQNSSIATFRGLPVELGKHLSNVFILLCCLQWKQSTHIKCFKFVTFRFVIVMGAVFFFPYDTFEGCFPKSAGKPRDHMHCMHSASLGRFVPHHASAVWRKSPLHRTIFRLHLEKNGCAHQYAYKFNDWRVWFYNPLQLIGNT